MKKQILFIVVIGFLTMNLNVVMAQHRPKDKPVQEQVETLTDAQTKKVNEILVNYDSKSISVDNAKSIMKAIKEAKVPGGKGLEKAVNDAGFDFENIKKLAPPPARPGKGKKQ